MSKQKPTVQLNVRISPAINKKLDRLAYLAGVSKAAVVIDALTLHVAMHEMHVERGGK